VGTKRLGKVRCDDRLWGDISPMHPKYYFTSIPFFRAATIEYFFFSKVDNPGRVIINTYEI
jgi:hypothetical protein